MPSVITDGLCMRCGYDLTGLPMTGTCPECGQEYDGHTRAGIGSSFAARQARQARLLGRLRTIALALVGVFCLSCGGLMSITVSQTPLRALVIGVVFGGVFLIAALTSFLYEDRSG